MARTWQTVRDNIRRMAGYADGWDSYGGMAAKPGAARKALQWAATFEAVGFPPAWVTLEGGGEFNFEWDRDGHTVSVDTNADAGDRFAAFFTEPVRLSPEQVEALRRVNAAASTAWAGGGNRE
jgi:plastocyanin